MGVVTVARIATQTLSNLCLLIAVCLTFVSMFSSQWLITVVKDDESYNHGLYRDCDKNPLKNTKGEWMCHWKFTHETDPSLKNDVYQLHEWQVKVMALLGSACALAMLATICACLTCCIKHCSIPWAVLSLFASILSLAGLITFFRYSQDKNIRFYVIPTTSRQIEQEYGLAFELAVSGCVLYFIGTILAFVGVAAVFLAARQHAGVKSSHHLNGLTTKV